MRPLLDIPVILRCFRYEAQAWHSFRPLQACRRRLPVAQHLRQSRFAATAATGRRNEGVGSHLYKTTDDFDVKADHTLRKQNDYLYDEAHEAQSTFTGANIIASDTLKTIRTRETREHHSERLEEKARRLMRRLPNSVVVLTASAVKQTDSTSIDEHDHSHSLGVAISSFSAVTLGPPCIISFNLRKPSRSLNAIQSVGFFRVSVLEGNETGRIIASAFLKFQHAAAYDHLQAVKQETVVNRRLTPKHDARAPEFASAIASLSCELRQCVDVEDHVIVVAQVLSVNGLPPADKLPSRVGLLYFDGDFGQAQPLSPLNAQDGPDTNRIAVDQ